MPNTNRLPASDPVDRHLSRSSSGRWPIPLIATHYDIDIIGGLADVTTTRTFRNAEPGPIEALLTIPLPVHAVLYELEVRIGDRLLKGACRSKAAARERYEQAVDDGKTAVLHEEVLRGIHLISVGQIGPDSEVVVAIRFALALSSTNGVIGLRIPTTVGDIYGSSGLPDSDELTHAVGGSGATLSISCDSGEVHTPRGPWPGEKTPIRLDVPIDLEVRNWSQRTLHGTAADGRAVSLDIAPTPKGKELLNAAILVDSSGSMADRFDSSVPYSKAVAVVDGLEAITTAILPEDRLSLWDFNTTVRNLGTTTGLTWATLLSRLPPPSGGTEIGAALQAILAARRVRDILLITDGKSHALPVQFLARSGVRFTVVLVGEDSLEANVGHLAALTGGHIIVPRNTGELPAAVQQAVDGMRLATASRDSANGSSSRGVRSGMTAMATWQTSTHDSMTNGHRAVAAYAASLRLASLDDAAAATLAEAEGLVTHLTSLVLVDHDGVTHNGLPATRKVALPTPRTAPTAVRTVHMEKPGAPAARSASRSSRERKMATRRPPVMRACYANAYEDDTPRGSILDVRVLAVRIDWRNEAARLSEGKLVGLSPEVLDMIDLHSCDPEIRKVAKRLGMTPEVFVIALLARSASGRDRFADRVYRALFAKLKREDMAMLSNAERAIGL